MERNIEIFKVIFLETTSNSLTRYQVCGTACCNPPLTRNKSKKAREEPTQAKQSELTTGKISSDIYLKEKRSIWVVPVVNSSFFLEEIRVTKMSAPILCLLMRIMFRLHQVVIANGQSAMRTTFIRLK